jgi:hypothetical protein
MPESEDFFAAMMVNHPAKIFFVVVSLLYVFPFSFADYGIIWFIRNSATNRRTLMNMLVVALGRNLCYKKPCIQFRNFTKI